MSAKSCDQEGQPCFILSPILANFGGQKSRMRIDLSQKYFFDHHPIVWCHSHSIWHPLVPNHRLWLGYVRVASGFELPRESI